MANLAIRGHAIRGKEVIELLEMLGGYNPCEYVADSDCFGFYIGNETRNISYDWFYNFEGKDVIILTLEEFLEKFPYKVWDKVQHNGATSCGTVYVIERMKWANNHIEYEIRPLHDYNYTGLVTVCAEDLQPFEEETMIEKLEQITLDIPDEYEFFGINDDNKVVLTKKQPQYPKTYEECCQYLGYDDRIPLKIIGEFTRLINARNTYWKIAGEQLGLEEPWQPNWNHINRKFYCIYNSKNNIVKNVIYSENKILVFPTAEMRDAFYENFKTLIEECKEVL